MSAAATPALAQRLIDIRRQLHQYPELSGEEYETTAAIKRWLDEAGIRILDSGLPTGVIAEIGGLGEQSRPIVALRADIDALPIQEETGLPFASLREQAMHACGHDFHTAVLLGAAFLLKEREQELQGVVRLLFQPAEEKAKGAQQLIERGALADVEVIYGLHNKPELPVGTVGIRSGELMAAADGFVVEVDGIGAHAAAPETGHDPIVTASHIITALQSIVSRQVSSLDSAVISVTRLHAGSAWNVISDKAIFDGTIRSFAADVREHVRSRFEQLVTGVADAFGTTARVKWIQGPPAVINDPQWAAAAARTARGLPLTVIEPEPSPAGEDFAFYLQETPGAFLFIGTGGPHPWHHPAFDIDEAALPGTAELFAALARDALSELTARPRSSRDDEISQRTERKGLG